MPFSGTMFVAANPACFRLRPIRLARAICLAASLFALIPPVAAQQAEGPDRATRAAMERRTAARSNLSEALARVAANATDADALLAAGRAATELEDYRSALGFLVRAEKLSPQNGDIKAALGSAMVRMERPGKALEYFADAKLMGAAERLFLSDRGLARDLMGGQAAAQRDYQLALSLAPDAETTRRFALSLGISGETDRAVALLADQLRDQDRSAWRTRAMILAINGRNSEAIDIVKATMPPTLATSIIPYLAQLDRLTPEQQAAAAHFGRFPSSDAPARPPQQIALAKPVATPAPVAAPAPSPQIRRDPPAAIPAPAPAPARAEVRQAPQAASVVETVASPAKDAPVVVAAAPGPSAPGPVAPPSVTPGFSIAAIGTATAPPGAAGPASPVADNAPEVAEAPAAAPAAAPLASLADIANSIEIPAEELAREAGALDAAALEKLVADNRRALAAAEAREEKEAAAAKALAEREAKAKAETAARKSNPARAWVQIATGSPVKALAFDYRRLAKKYPGSFKGQSGATTEWGQTRRLLVGPFKSGKAADEWLTAYKKAGGEGFTFDSDAGQLVEPLK